VPRARGVLCSTLWRPSVAPARAATLTQVAAVAAIAALAALRVEARLKWPNDVLFEGAKVGGILLESAIEGGRLRHAVVGIGLNVNQMREELPVTPYPATSLALATGRQFDRNALAAELLLALDRTYRGWLHDATGVYQRWRAGIDTFGQPVAVGEVVGVARDVDADGALVIERQDGSWARAVSGEVAPLA
jgi:BirA family biotin operon repressor/biotin-[acetyl-CoA-carboxylase] ligase